MVLSGMSNMEQMKDNIKTFSESKSLSEAETALLYSAAAKLSEQLPCTGCRYCCAGCPRGLNIPLLLSLCNELRVSDSMNAVARYDALGDKTAAACVGCGRCAAACPQKIDVPEAMKELVRRREGKKSWREICIERDKARAALSANK